jgi:putative endonuclease
MKAFFMFYCYIIQSESSGKLYIGQTNDLSDRMRGHNAGFNISTKNKGPWKKVFYKCFDSRSEAIKLEKKLKGFKNPAKIFQWIAHQN